MVSWVPLLQRGHSVPEPGERMVDGVPFYLHESLRDWVYRVTTSDVLARVTARLRLDGAVLRAAAEARKHTANGRVGWVHVSPHETRS
jgi:hypothetical protein